MKTRDDILRELAATRRELAARTAAVRAELDFVAKANAVVRKKPLAFLGGAAALGWFLAGPKTKTRVVTKIARYPGERPRTIKKPTRSRGVFGFLSGLLRLLLPALKPAVTAYVARRLSEAIGRTN